MKHIQIPGKNKHVLILLHGTGGSASSLFEVGQFIDPEATMIGFQGEVEEQGMARYFARYHDGTFDLRSLASATYDFQDTLKKVIKQYQLENHEITVIGYSNGANLALNVLKEFEQAPFHRAFLFHPSPVRPTIPLKAQKDLQVLLTSGANDPYISEAQFRTLKQAFSDAGIAVEVLHHAYGHQLIQEELDRAKALVIQ
ncbi:alpha/beta hydrolase [Enterococcus sp. LJL98]